jgi:Xaa-Pro dipeptidase
MPKDLPFSRVEFRARLLNVRQDVAARGLAGLLVHTPENIYYLTGYHTPGYYRYQTCIVPLDREPVLVVRGFELPNVEALAWLKRGEGYDDTEDYVAKTASVLDELGLGEQRLGVEEASWFLTPRDLRRLREARPRARFEDASGLVEQWRLVKSNAEVEYIRRACRAAEAGVQAGLGALRAGVTENDVAAEVLHAMVKAGSEYAGLPPFVAAGERTAWPHATWSGRRIDPGDPLILEIGGCVRRYSGALWRCAVAGEPTEEMRRRDEVTRLALDETIAAMKAGTTGAEVNAVTQRVFDENGFRGVHKHRVGYSIGIAFPPDWGEGYIMSLQSDEHRPLQAGMTFHVIPMVMTPGLAIANTDTVLVTPGGGERLSQFPRGLYVAPG